MTDVHRAIADHHEGRISRSRLMRAITAHPSWYVLSQVVEDGGVALRMQQGLHGEWWISGFTDAERLGAYARALELDPSNHVIVKGSSLFRNLPGGAAGVAFETLTSEAVAFHQQELPWLRTQGHAFEVELALAGTSSRPDPMDLVRTFGSYLLLRSPSGYLHADGLTVVCTTEDALEAWVADDPAARDPALERAVLDGDALFPELTSGVVFNPAGPPAPVRKTGAEIAAAIGASVPVARVPAVLVPPAPAIIQLPPGPPQAPSPTIPGQGPPAAPPIEPTPAVHPDEAEWDIDDDETHVADRTIPRHEPIPAATAPDPVGPIVIDENASPRVQHRAVSHVLLPAMLKQSPRATLDSLLDQGRAGDLLARLWATAGEKLAPHERVSLDGLAVLGAKQLVEASVVLIAMPPPQAVLEAHFVAVAVMADQRLRYFKLEASYDGVAAVTEAGIEQPKRANFGFVEPCLPAFSSKLATILAR